MNLLTTFKTRLNSSSNFISRT